MIYDASVAGFGVTLRCADEADAAFMYALRTAPHVIGRIGDPPPSVEAQAAWIRKVKASADDSCFIIEQDGLGPVGTISLTRMNETAAEPGRWVLRPGSTAAAASCLLVYGVAFERLGFEKIRMSVSTRNLRVLSFHRRYGARETNIDRQSRVFNGVVQDMLWFEVARAEWPRVKAFLERQAELAQRVARRSAELRAAG